MAFETALPGLVGAPALSVGLYVAALATCLGAPLVAMVAGGLALAGTALVVASGAQRRNRTERTAPL